MDGVLAPQQGTRQAAGFDSRQCDATKEGVIGATGNPINKNLLASHALLGSQNGCIEMSKPHGWNSYHNVALQGHLQTSSQLTGK